MKRFFLLLSFFLMAGLLPPAPVSGAQGRPAPAPPSETLRQTYWSLPDCAFAEMILVPSRDFVLRLSRGRLRIERIGNGRTTDGYYFYEGDKDQLSVLRADGGTLYQYYGAAAEAEGRPSALDGDKSVVRLSYRLCPDLRQEWAAPYRRGLARVFPRLDGVAQACGGGKIAADSLCRRAVFAAFDADGGGSLDGAELADAYGDILWLAASRACDSDGVFPAADDGGAALFAQETAALADIDGDGAVTLDELAARWPALAGSKTASALLRESAALYEIMPFLPESGPHPSCLVCTPADPQPSCPSPGCGR